MKAIFFDVDNTLLDEKTHQLVDSGVEALNKLKEAGYLIFLATSRSSCEIDIFKDRVTFDGKVLSNGGRVFVGDKLIQEHLLTSEELAALLALVDKYPDYNLVYNHTDEVVNIFRDNHNHDYSWFSKNNIILHKRALKITDKVFQLFIKGELNYDDPLIKKLSNCGINELFKNYTAVLPNNTNKAKGIEKVVEYLGLDIDDCACVGDGINDIEMFQLIKDNYCVDNGNPLLKEVANEVIGRIDEDSIYKLCIAKGWIK